MFKKKLVDKKNKLSEEFDNSDVVQKAVDKNYPLVLCDCGKEVHGDSHQCWACAHRP